MIALDNQVAICTPEKKKEQALWRSVKSDKTLLPSPKAVPALFKYIPKDSWTVLETSHYQKKKANKEFLRTEERREGTARIGLGRK